MLFWETTRKKKHGCQRPSETSCKQLDNSQKSMGACKGTSMSTVQILNFSLATLTVNSGKCQKQWGKTSKAFRNIKVKVAFSENHMSVRNCGSKNGKKIKIEFLRSWITHYEFISPATCLHIFLHSHRPLHLRDKHQTGTRPSVVLGIARGVWRKQGEFCFIHWMVELNHFYRCTW